MPAQFDDNSYMLERSSESDIDTIMAWFDTRGDVTVWGGPKFRFPFTRDSFRNDCHWPEMDSFSLRDLGGELLAFGQLYDLNHRINLARLIVRPDRRGQGVGRCLIGKLMDVGQTLLPLDEFSLFVLRDNLAALNCYRSLGFEIQDYPPDQVFADVCYYLTRPVNS